LVAEAISEPAAKESKADTSRARLYDDVAHQREWLKRDYGSIQGAGQNAPQRIKAMQCLLIGTGLLCQKGSTAPLKMRLIFNKEMTLCNNIIW